MAIDPIRTTPRPSPPPLPAPTTHTPPGDRAEEVTLDVIFESDEVVVAGRAEQRRVLDSVLEAAGRYAASVAPSPYDEGDMERRHTLHLAKLVLPGSPFERIANLAQLVADQLERQGVASDAARLAGEQRPLVQAWAEGMAQTLDPEFRPRAWTGQAAAALAEGAAYTARLSPEEQRTLTSALETSRMSDDHWVRAHFDGESYARALTNAWETAVVRRR